MRLKVVRFINMIHVGGENTSVCHVDAGWEIEAQPIGVVLRRDGQTIWVPLANVRAADVLEEPAASLECADCGQTFGALAGLSSHRRNKHGAAA